MQILASGKTGAQRYDDNNVNKPVPDLDLISIGQTNQRAFEETQGWSYSNNKGSTDSQAASLSVIEEGDVNDYNPSLAQLIQTYVANNSYLDVNGSSTANNIILEPRKIADVNSPNGVNYSKTTSLPFAFRDNLRFCFRATATNTGAVQFSITGLSGLSGAIDSVDENGNALSGGEIVSGKFYEIVLTGTATTKKVILLNADTFDNLTVNNKIRIISNSETIASGSIPYSGTNIVVDTEGAAASDDLDTISGANDGDIAILQISDSSRNVVLKHGTGNLNLINGQDITLDTVTDKIVLMFRGSSWDQLSRTLTSDFTSSQATNGYSYLPNGIIIQWGQVSAVPTNSTKDVTLPLTFPNACWSAVNAPSNINNGELDGDSFATEIISTSTLRFKNNMSAFARNGQWIAIGN